ncbi:MULTISPECIES: hypothetical protein [unclassified Dietzia]|uniref:hypothetical protein n=1 Tax=unclassified Dietzia TaxID=2617939 RepID=UPI0013164191|nr:MULTISPECIES: hypothetical protein [unclassified Dietzia]QGW23590.1 hypothetical protein GJR88_00823 [Dietzia sp. DQ12-45-1b]
MTQLSFFAADEHVPEPNDLEGALAARGQSTLAGALAQVSVALDAAWRADALVALLTEAGLDPVRSAAGPDGRCTVSTARTAVLVPVVRRWRRGAVAAVPEGWTPSAGALRVWFLTAGRITAAGAIDLGLDPGVEQHAPRRAALAEALARAGIRATYVGPRGDGPLLRLGTARARARLAQALGAAPPGVPPGAWPD